MRGYYFITDASLSAAGILGDAEKAVACGTRIIQYRSKEASTAVLFREAMLLKRICSGTGSRLLINDRVDIALAVDADGVHLGQDDLPYGEARRLLGRDKLIGMSVHSVQEALQAERAGADYLGVGPIFQTATKGDAGSPCGIETLRAIRQACRVPLVAIGGIDLSRVQDVVQAGADMVCAISAVAAGPDVASGIKKFQKEFGL
jgi:thiamine-phosphate pyrophosphorylase